MKIEIQHVTFGDVAKSHQRAIARKTMAMHCIGALVMGGMDHVLAARLLGCKLPKDCTCDKQKQEAK